jgi:hypothetical protein
MINWAMDTRQAELHTATMQATSVRHFRTSPMGEVASMHGYYTTGWRALQLPEKVVLSMARFRLSCFRKHLLFSYESTKDTWLRFAGLPMSRLRDLMQCENVGSVAWFVHECMERVDNSHAG